MSQQTTEEAIEYLAMYVNFAASIDALRAGRQKRRVLWPWRGDDLEGRRHLQRMEASAERQALCRQIARRAVQLVNQRTPV